MDGNVVAGEYDFSVDDANAEGKDFSGTVSDIDALFWGLASGPAFPGDPSDVWYTFGMTVEAQPINTTGDGTSPFPSPTTIQLGLAQGGDNKYALNAMMFGGNVLLVQMWDLTTPTPTEVVLDASNLKHKIGTGLEIAIKSSEFVELTPDAFSFDLHFEGGGENEDDRLQGVVPEPATMSILMIGGLVVARRRRKRAAA